MADRTCPACGKDRVCSVAEAEAVYQTGAWSLADAEYVCTFCRALRVDGRWATRAQEASDRAWQLAQAGSKDYDECAAALGDLPDEPVADDRSASGGLDTDFEW